MADIEYQKIELHSTYELGKDQEIIEYEKDIVQRLMIENQIEFAIEIEEKDIKSDVGRHFGFLYVLNLIIRKEDSEKVIELLDKEGGLGYYLDLDECFDPNEENKLQEDKEDVEECIFEEIPEEFSNKLSEEFENEDKYNNPIKDYEENRNIISKFFAALHKLLNKKKGE